MTNYPHDNFDGRPVPQLIVRADHTIAGTHRGTVQVEAGHFQLSGKLHGTLAIHPGCTATISGEQHGTVSVGRRSRVIVAGGLHGTVSIDHEGQVIIEPSGKLSGTVQNNGLVVVRGVFGGALSGGGELRLEGDGYIKQPSRVEGNSRYYEW